MEEFQESLRGPWVLDRHHLSKNMIKKTSMSPLNTSPMSGDQEPQRHRRTHVREMKPMEVRRIEPVGQMSDDINDCAEAFIKRFRQDLQIQRLESIENYEQMLARGL